MATLEETVYRPPLENESALLEISLGCSYGRCTFCRYSDGNTPLQLLSPEMLCENLEELVAQGEQAKRMFLLGGNVLAFKSRYLADIFRLVRRYLPGVTQFSMYARADDVAQKTDEQLEELRRGGLDTLYIGVESGNARILENCRKGETPKEIVAALHRLDRVGLSYGLSSILGLGGREMWWQNALDTAALYNEVNPISIRVMTLTPMAGTPLAVEAATGSFRPLTPRQALEEERLLLEAISKTHAPCLFVGTHVSNSVPVKGMLPRDRDRMIEALSNAIAGADDKDLAQDGAIGW